MLAGWGLAAALVVMVLAAPAVAKPAPTSLEATLSGEADPDGSGSALLSLDTKTRFGTICHQIHVDNVATPLTGGAIMRSGSNEIVGRLIITDSGQDVDGCTAQAGIKTRDLKRIENDPGSYVLHLYNDEHPCDVSGPEQTCPPGAVAGQLEATA
jgi:hypothetical protein